MPVTKKEAIPLNGYCAPAFLQVKSAFEHNLTQRGEIGACVSVFLKGEKVVDLWGGYSDSQGTIPWKENTICCVMSVTKAIASLAVISLADKGIINLDDPVCSFWPEFAQSNKENISVRCILSQLAGIPVADAAPEGSLYEPGVIERALEIQSPLWPPGTTPCYHSFTHGPLCQAIIQKCTGKTLGQYLAQDLLGPHDIDFHLGMGEAELERCADITIAEGVPTLQRINDPDSLLARAWRPLPKSDNLFQDQRFRTSEFSSGNGHSNARNIAKLYGMLSMVKDTVKGSGHHQLISKTLLEDVISEQWNGVEVMTHRHFRYGTGFMLNNPYFKTGDNPRNFGHPGLGGANAFADPDAQIGFAYCCNLVHPIEETGPCASALIEAMYSSI